MFRTTELPSACFSFYSFALLILSKSFAKVALLWIFFFSHRVFLSISAVPVNFFSVLIKHSFVAQDLQAFLFAAQELHSGVSQNSCAGLVTFKLLKYLIASNCSSFFLKLSFWNLFVFQHRLFLHQVYPYRLCLSPMGLHFWGILHSDILLGIHLILLAFWLMW